MAQQFKLDAELILRMAENHWDEILRSLAPALVQALDAAPKHVPCPIHGGENGFRFFKDYRRNGGCICNTCGAFDGLHILMEVNKWNFYTALKSVNDFLKVPEGIDPATVGETVDGRVLFAGMGTLRSGSTCFSIRLKLENGREKSFWGSDLKRASQEAGIAVGDNARVSRLGTKTFQWKGKEVKKTLWSVRRLPSDAERLCAAKNAQEEAARRSISIASKWDSARILNPQMPDQRPLMEYFKCRSILPDNFSQLRSIRFSASEAYVDEKGEVVGKFPAMISAVRDAEGELVTLHRTYLTPNGTKISFGPAKKLMALPAGRTINGASIQLGSIGRDGILCVAEGVETALSVVKATGYPCASTISANGMSAYVPPRGVKAVFIFADKDKSLTGQKAADTLRARLLEKGIPAVVCLPNEADLFGEKGVDWNDVLRLRGQYAFPFHR